MHLKLKINRAAAFLANFLEELARKARTRPVAKNDRTLIWQLLTALNPDCSFNRTTDYFEFHDQYVLLTEARRNERVRRFIDNLSDYDHAQRSGIIAEWAYLKRHGGPMREKAIWLLEREIALIRDHLPMLADIIPTAEVKWDEEAYLAQLREFLEVRKWRELGLHLLRRLSPYPYVKFQPGIRKIFLINRLLPVPGKVLLNIPNAARKITLQKLTDRVGDAIANAPYATPKRLGLNSHNHQLLLEYLLLQKEPAVAAYVALTLEGLPSSFRSTGPYIGLLWLLADQYRECGPLEAEDQWALIRLYRYIIDHFDFLRADQSTIPPGVVDLNQWEALLRRSLGNCYGALWETEKALAEYRHAASIADRTSDERGLYQAIFSIIRCLKNTLRREDAIVFISQLLQGDDEALQLGQPCHLNTALKEVLEIQLVELIYQPNAIRDSEKRHLFQRLRSPAGLLLRDISPLLNPDRDISEELFSQSTNLFTQDSQSLSEGSAGGTSQLFTIKVALARLSFQDLEPAEFRNEIERVGTFFEFLSEKEQFLFYLLKAKLKFLDTDASSIVDFEHLFSDWKEKDFQLVTRKGHWYVEYLRSFSLLDQKGEGTIDKIKRLTCSAVEYISQGVLNNLNEQTAVLYGLQDLENLCRTLLIVAESSSGQEKQTLLRILWEALIYKFEFINSFQNDRQYKVVDPTAYRLANEEVRTALWNFFTKGNTTISQSDLIDKIWKTRAFRYYSGGAAQSLPGTLELPINRTVLFNFWSAGEKTESLLELAYFPVSGLFEYVIHNLSDQAVEQSKPSEKPKALLKKLRQLELTTPYKEAYRRKLFSEEAGSEDETVKSVFLYGDKALHLLPFESKRGLRPGHPCVGVYTDFLMVLNRAEARGTIDLSKGIALFSEVPELPGFPYLAGTRLEANTIEQLAAREGIPISSWRGQAANRHSLQLALDRKPAVLHFALHGVADAKLPPEATALVLAPLVGQPASALLTYRDIHQLDFSSAGLIVLSACNSAVGAMPRGYPMQGLAQALLHAGARYVVASRVAVRDRPTAMIMNRFYQELLKTKTVPSAMRRTRAHFFSDRDASIVDIQSWGVWV